MSDVFTPSFVSWGRTSYWTWNSPVIRPSLTSLAQKFPCLWFPNSKIIDESPYYPSFFRFILLFFTTCHACMWVIVHGYVHMCVDTCRGYKSCYIQWSKSYKWSYTTGHECWKQNFGLLQEPSRYSILRRRHSALEFHFFNWVSSSYCPQSPKYILAG